MHLFPRPLLRPTSVNFWQYCRNLSHATVPLSTVLHYQYCTCEHVVKAEGAAYGNDKAPGLMVSYKEVWHRLEMVPATAV